MDISLKSFMMKQKTLNQLTKKFLLNHKPKEPDK